MTGGIASYKAVPLARALTQAGAEVDVVLTRGAARFVGAVTFEALTGRRCHDDMFERGEPLSHIRLAREADVVIIAPATADFIARAAHGRADDLLAAILLATRAPVLLSPAMNDRMWSHPQTRANTEQLRSIGYRVIEPATGALAFGEGEGPGRLPEPDDILDHVARALSAPSVLAGKRIIVTAGATREAIDPVRFISNHSTGRMGIAIARAAWLRGARVTLIAGSVEVPIPRELEAIRVTSAQEMLSAVSGALADADVLVMAAAPADFRPAHPAAQKIKKATAPEAIALEPTPDILHATRSARRDGAIVVGFALETDDMITNARTKLAEKRLDMIVANRAGVEGEGIRS